MLTGLADLGQQEVAVVADALLGVQGPGVAQDETLVLPLVEATDDRDDVGVADVPEGLGGERRADAARAVDRDRRVLVGRRPST